MTELFLNFPSHKPLRLKTGQLLLTFYTKPMQPSSIPEIQATLDNFISSVLPLKVIGIIN